MNWRISTIFILVLAALIFFKASQRQLKHPDEIVERTPKRIQEPPPVKEFTFEDALNSISEASIKKNVYYLASPELEGRMSGKHGNVVAFDFIKKKYESFGLKTMYQKFSIERMNPGPKNEIGDDFTQNCMAWIEGSDPILKDEIVVCAGHADHIGQGPRMSTDNKIGIHPGADDNASGTCGVLEVAKACSKLKPRRTILFQSYSAEEMGLIGSRYYVHNPLFPLGHPDIHAHIFMVNCDMIGWLNKGGTYKKTYSSKRPGTSDITRYIDELNEKYPFAKRITSQSGNDGGSDHASFYNAGVPIAFLFTGMHPGYHAIGDTPDKLNIKGIQQVAQYAFELTWKVANADQRPTFNWGDFQAMESPYDHDQPEVKFPNYEKEK